MKAAALFERLVEGYRAEYRVWGYGYWHVRFIVDRKIDGVLFVKTYLRDGNSYHFDLIDQRFIRSGTARKLSDYMLKQLAKRGYDNHVIDWDAFRAVW